MTIAAGFCCDDGVLLCSDSQETLGDFKRNQAKITVKPEYREPASCRAVFAGAGDSTFIDIVVQKLWDAIRSETGNIDDFIRALEDRAIAIHQRYWPVYTEKDRPTAHLLIALCCKDWPLKLLRVEGPLVLEITGYDCVGYGVPLAKYLCDRMWEIPMSLKPTLFVALYMLEQVKQHAEYCGGHSAFTLIQKDGKVRTATRIYPSVNAELVSYFEEFDEAVALLLAAGPNLEITSEKYDERLSAFSERMRNLRRQFRSLNTLNKITLKDLTTEWEFRDIPF